MPRHPDYVLRLHLADAFRDLQDHNPRQPVSLPAMAELIRNRYGIDREALYVHIVERLNACEQTLELIEAEGDEPDAQEGLHTSVGSLLYASRMDPPIRTQRPTAGLDRMRADEADRLRELRHDLDRGSIVEQLAQGGKGILSAFARDRAQLVLEIRARIARAEADPVGPVYEILVDRNDGLGPVATGDWCSSDSDRFFHDRTEAEAALAHLRQLYPEARWILRTVNQADQGGGGQ